MDEKINEEVEAMEKNKLEVELQIKRLKEHKKELQQEIKSKVYSNRTKKENYSNGGNSLMRVADDFKKRIENIEKERKDNKFSKISHPKKTELITKHKNWNMIERDIIYFQPNIKEIEN